MDHRLPTLLRHDQLLHCTRRHFLSECGLGLGALWLAATSGRAWGAAGAVVKDPRPSRWRRRPRISRRGRSG